MVNAVRDCAAFVVIMTPESEMSHWVELEVAWAHRWNKPMFPILRDGENWPVFELTQYANVLDGTLPDQRFLRELSNHAPYKNTHGQNITPQAQAERPAQSIDLAAPPAAVPEEAFDTYAAITGFFRLRDEQHWIEAQRLLLQIEQAGQTPRWFDTAQYAQDIQTAIEHEKAEREYTIIRNIAQHEKPERVWTALQNFWQSFDGYDPDNIAEKILSTEAKHLLDVMLNPDISLLERADAGRKLAQVGDPRRGVGLRDDGLPDIDWVEIPAGDFLIGSTDAHVAGLKVKPYWSLLKNETPQHWLKLPAYWIARFPVTVGQYEIFLQNGGYQERRWWTETGWQWKGKRKQPSYWNDAKWHITNHPVIGVSWYEAYAYTQWLSAVLDKIITLPTEAQWEKAARGTDGRLFPWGNNYQAGYANINETHQEISVGSHYLERTTSVGMYPQGASPYGVLDMSGNVWEWCLPQSRESYSEPINHDPEVTTLRVRRGGSWYFNVHFARCASRVERHPSHGDDYVGFRVVCSASI